MRRVITFASPYDAAKQARLEWLVRAAEQRLAYRRGPRQVSVGHEVAKGPYTRAIRHSARLAILPYA